MKHTTVHPVLTYIIPSPRSWENMSNEKNHLPSSGRFFLHQNLQHCQICGSRLLHEGSEKRTLKEKKKKLIEKKKENC